MPVNSNSIFNFPATPWWPVFPWNFVVGRFHPFYRGLNAWQKGWVYVNPGTGYWGPPMRIGVESEITLLTLKQRRTRTDRIG